MLLGNDNRNLDHLEYGNPFPQTDLHPIMVETVSSADRSPAGAIACDWTDQFNHRHVVDNRGL